MRKALVVLIILATALIACERQEDRPVVPQGTAPALNLENEITFLRGVVRDDPQNLQAWIKLGNHLMDSQRFSEAIEAYGKALELDPSDVNVTVDRGICYRRIGRPDMAAEHFRKAIKLSPNHPFAHRNLGVVLAFDLKDYEGGRKEFEKYLELSPAASDAQQMRQLINELRAAEEAHPQGGATP